MPENDCLNGYLNEIELGFVEQEATPILLMKLSIQLYLAGLSLSNTVSILEVFGVSRARFTVDRACHRIVRMVVCVVRSQRLQDRHLRSHSSRSIRVEPTSIRTKHQYPSLNGVFLTGCKRCAPGARSSKHVTAPNSNQADESVGRIL
jgi:hypothetical protein